MAEDQRDPPAPAWKKTRRLALVSGSRRLRLDPERFAELARLELWVSSLQDPPFAVDARVIEEDTHLVLSAGNQLPEAAEPAIRVMTAALYAEPCALGAVVVRPGAPRLLLTVVHDLDLSPSCRPQAVREALARALERSRALGVRALAVPLLGAVHGVLPPEQALGLVLEVLSATSLAHLERVWLVVDEAHQARLTARLTALQ